MDYGALGIRAKSRLDERGLSWLLRPDASVLALCVIIRRASSKRGAFDPLSGTPKRPCGINGQNNEGF